HLAVVAVDAAVGLAPHILLATLRTTELGLAARPLLLARPVLGFQIKPPARSSKLVIDLLEPATGNDVVVHVLAGFLSAHHASRRRLQADHLHLRCPLPIMIAALRAVPAACCQTCAIPCTSVEVISLSLQPTKPSGLSASSCRPVLSTRPLNRSALN